MLVTEKAKLDAEEVRSATWASGFPVDPERIATSLGIVVRRHPLDDEVSGILRVEPDADPEIFVRESDSHLRQKFTIAHEIGHYVERTNSGEVDFNFMEQRGMEYDLHEFYADEFAGNLLMPTKEVQRLVDEGYSAVRMMKHFGLSLPAIRMRLKRLGLS